MFILIMAETCRCSFLSVKMDTAKEAYVVVPTVDVPSVLLVWGTPGARIGPTRFARSMTI